jgi:hypothetical protein
MYSSSWFISIDFVVVGFNNNGLEASDSLENTGNYIIFYPLHLRFKASGWHPTT